MKTTRFLTGVTVVTFSLVLSSTLMAQQKKEEEKAQPLKASGDVGLLDLEKNYMILVTKEGKLITAEFSPATKVTKLVPQKVKMSDINLGQSATVTYVTKGEKKTAESVEYVVKAKKGE